MTQRKILLFEKDLEHRRQLEFVLDRHQLTPEVISSTKQLTQTLQKAPNALALLDYRSLGKNPKNTIQKIKDEFSELLIILICNYNDQTEVGKLKKTWADGIIARPIDSKELLHQIELLHSKKPKPKKKSTPIFDSGESQSSRQILKHLKLVAPTDMNVIVEGESGTGKEIVARTLVHYSRRKRKPFVALDCGAIPKELAASELFGHKKGAFTGALSDKKGSFELAHRGTLFLDEIGNLSYQNQIKLLRVLQEGTIHPLGSNQEIMVDVRVIAATNENLEELISKGKFREDLYHRLKEFHLHIPPIRQRQEDIPYFLKYFLKQANEKLNKSIEGFDRTTLKLLRAYDWPGNLREMKNVIQRAALLCDNAKIQLKHLPQEVISPNDNTTSSGRFLPLRLQVEQVEKSAILDALEHCDWNKSKAAQLLQVERKTLYNKIKQYNLYV